MTGQPSSFGGAAPDLPAQPQRRLTDRERKALQLRHAAALRELADGVADPLALLLGVVSPSQALLAASLAAVDEEEAEAA